MRPATDSAIRFSRSAFATLIGLAAAVNGAGCTRLEQFRQKDLPALGAAITGRAKQTEITSKTDPTASRSVDTYAQSIKNKQALAAQEQLAARDPASKRADAHASLAAREQDEELDLAARHDSESPAGRRLPVSLQPPVPLDDPPLLAASTSPTSAGWQPRGTRDERGDESTRTQTHADDIRALDQRATRAEAIVRRARTSLDKMENYQVRLNRQERVGGKLLPVEDVLLSIRRNPKAVRLEWPDGPHKGREVIYSASENGGLMQVNMADSPVPVPRLSLPPDSPLVMSNSRHPITEAGFDTILENLEAAIRLEKAGTPTSGKVEYAGAEQTEGLNRPCEKLVRVTPSGETWLVYIDPTTNLPSLVCATARDGSLLERYLFLDVKGDLAELAQADAFDASRRWGPPKGLLSRLVRPAAAPAASAESDTVTR